KAANLIGTQAVRTWTSQSPTSITSADSRAGGSTASPSADLIGPIRKNIRDGLTRTRRVVAENLQNLISSESLAQTPGSEGPYGDAFLLKNAGVLSVQEIDAATRV